jgi:hypothetical protein
MEKVIGLIEIMTVYSCPDAKSCSSSNQEEKIDEIYIVKPKRHAWIILTLTLISTPRYGKKIFPSCTQ